MISIVLLCLFLVAATLRSFARCLPAWSLVLLTLVETSLAAVLRLGSSLLQSGRCDLDRFFYSLPIFFADLFDVKDQDRVSSGV